MVEGAKSSPSTSSTRFGLRSMFWAVWVASTLVATLQSGMYARNGVVSVSNVITAVVGPILFGIALGMLMRGNFVLMVIGWCVAMLGYVLFAWS